MKQFNATWNGTMSQARDMVEAWKQEQAEKARRAKMAIWFSRSQAIQEAREAIYSNN